MIPIGKYKDISVYEIINEEKNIQLMIFKKFVGIVAVYRLTKNGEIFEFYPVMFDYEYFDYYDTIIKEVYKKHYAKGDSLI